MLQNIEIIQIKERAEAIGLSLKRLCHIAKVDPSTLYKSGRGQVIDHRVGTLRKIIAALEAEEKRVADHLAKLHPAAPTLATPLSITAIEEGDAA